MIDSKISVIIPLRSLSYFLLYEGLPALQTQSFKKFEVIILPNEHSQYDVTLLKTYKWLRIIPTGKITRPAKKRDIGVQYAKGDIIAFLDDDAYPDLNWLKNAVKIFKKNKIDVVCGPGLLPHNTNNWEKVFDEVLKTWIGSGGYSYRFIKQKKRYVADYPSMNFFIHKKTFLKLGGFNSMYWPGEDSKLCNDLIEKEKGKILYVPEIFVYHHRRNNLRGFLKQHSQYGFHRGAFFAHGDKNSRSVTYVVPTLFLIYLLILPFVFSNITLIPLLFYGLFMTYLLVKSFLNTWNVMMSISSVFVLLSTHITYGIMFIKGFYKGLNKDLSIYG